MTFHAATSHIFNNTAFWQKLSCAEDSVSHALGRLNSLLSLSKPVRMELLELPPTAGKRRHAAAEDLLFKQPESILHRAVATMFALREDSIYRTSMSIQLAKHQFSMTRRDVLAIMINARKDETSEGHRAAHFGRVTLMMMLPTVLARKGGLLRIATASANRVKSRQRSVAKSTAAAKQAILHLFKPLLAKAYPLTRAQKPYKRVVDNYHALKCEVQWLSKGLAMDKSGQSHVKTTMPYWRKPFDLCRARRFARQLEGACKIYSLWCGGNRI